MRWIYKLPLRFRSLFDRSSVETELNDELRFHLENLIEENVARGMAPDEARYAALRELGGVEQVKEECRDMRRVNYIENFFQDVRYGVRMLARNPAVTFVMVITLGLAIGANTAIFSVVYGVLLRSLPFPKPDHVVSVSELASDGHRMNFTDPNFDDIKASNHSLTGMAEYYWGVSTVSSNSGPARVGIAFVSRDFLRVMGVGPMLGREFIVDDQHVGAAPVALVSYGFWRQHLGASLDLSTSKLKMEDRAYAVVGVMPPGFSFPDDTAVWFPRELLDHLPSRTAHNWHVVGRLRDGVGLAAARSDLTSIAHRLKQQFGSDTDMADAGVVPLRESLTGKVRPALLILLGAVGFLLLVGCANVANLLLARATARGRELAIRTALGAGRARLVRQFLVEALLLSLSGGVLGILGALWGVHALVALAPHNLPRLEDISVNLPVLAFALAVVVLVALGLGVLTALRATSSDPQAALAEGSRAHAGSLSSQRAARILVAGQLAVTLVLLAGAGLLGRSLVRVLSLDPGYRTKNIVTMEIDVPRPASDSDISRPVNFLDALLQRLRRIPGVDEVGATSGLPLANDLSDGTFWLLDQQPKPINISNPDEVERFFDSLKHTPTGHADYCVASEGYFRALGIPLVRGRLFDDRDTMNAPHAAVISQSLARATWPNQDPLGKTIEFGNMDGDIRLLTVVGVAGDVRVRSLESPPAPTVYVNYRQRPTGGHDDFTVVIRAGTAPPAILAEARKIVRSLDPDTAPRFHTFQQVFETSLDTRHFNLSLIGGFAFTALLLASVGIYGVMAYWVTRRTREIGVRMALGALPGDVLRLVLAHSSRTVAIGLAVGLAGSFAFTRFLASLLYGVKPFDPITFVAVSLLLAGVALLASYLPARRAMKVDPMVALRYE